MGCPIDLPEIEWERRARRERINEGQGTLEDYQMIYKLDYDFLQGALRKDTAQHRREITCMMQFVVGSSRWHLAWLALKGTLWGNLHSARFNAEAGRIADQQEDV